MCLIAMTTGYTFSVAEKNNMVRLYGMLPVKKRELVIGRYLLILAQGAFALVISLIIQPFVLRAVGETIRAFDLVRAAVGGLFLFALDTVFQIPGYYQYGSIKGRVFMYIPVAGFLVTLFLFPQMPADRAFMTILGGSPVFLVASVIVLVIVMYAVSVWFSIRIMKTKKYEVSHMDFTILAVVLLIGVGIPARNKWIRKFRDKKRQKEDDRSSM